MSNSKDDNNNQYNDYQYPPEEGVVDSASDEHEVVDDLSASDEANQSPEVEIKDPAESRLKDLLASVPMMWSNISLNVKRGLFVALGALLIGGGISLFSGSSHKAQLQQQAQVQMAQEQAQANVATQKLQQAQVQLQSMRAQMNDLKSQVQSLTAANRSLRNQMMQAESGAAQASSSEHAQLLESIKQLSAQVAALKASNTVVPRRSAAGEKDQGLNNVKAVTIKQHYSLNAIIHGRAWVQNQNGRVLSVAVGDSLRDFGRVTRIDADKQLVESDSGQRIEFGMHVD